MDRPEPAVATMFRRAVVLKCPRCGSRRTFLKHWLGRYPRCRTCGIQWHREHGFELGPIALNVVITFFTLAVGMIIAFVATAPDIPVLPLTLGTVAAAIIIPLIAYPFTYTVWLAFDLASHTPDARELADAAAAVATGGAAGALPEGA
jgi:uncharacterized protein (DUF983 family)